MKDMSDMTELPKDRIVIASDVQERDGIGVEIYRENKLIIEIFRDDAERTRTVTIFQNEIDLELLEEYISIFKKEIQWDFIDYNNLEK